MHMFGVLLFVCTTNTVFALATYEPMTKIPGLGEGGDIVEFINTTYTALIAVGAMFGVIKIAYAGFKYSLSEVVSKKGEAVEEIKGVFIGLAVLLMPFMVLNTIYSPLTNLDVLKANLNPVIYDIPTQKVNPFTLQEGERMQTCLYDGQVAPLQAIDTLVYTPNGDSLREEARNMTQASCETKLKNDCGTSARIVNDSVNKKVTCFYSEYTSGVTVENCDVNESYDIDTCYGICQSQDGDVTNFDEEKGLITCEIPVKRNSTP